MTKTRNLTVAQLAVAASLPSGAQPCEILDDDGSTCHGYELGGVLTVLAVVVRSAAAQSAIDASPDVVALAQASTLRIAALAVVQAQVARVKAIAPASRTDQDKWLLALSYLTFAQQ